MAFTNDPYAIDLTKASNRGLAPTVQGLIDKGMSPAEAQQEVDAWHSRETGGGMSRAELKDFETLVGRLEGSKMRQAAQANRARQRDTMAGGLASMMSNF
jgi:hypothetical protein